MYYHDIYCVQLRDPWGSNKTHKYYVGLFLGDDTPIFGYPMVFPNIAVAGMTSPFFTRIPTTSSIRGHHFPAIAMLDDPGCMIPRPTPPRFNSDCLSWWLNHPFEKYAQVKLDHETPGIGVKIKNV